MRILLLALFLLIAQCAHAQHDAPIVGGRAHGLGGAAVTLGDVWSLFNNIGGLAAVDRPSVGLFAENRFGTAAFNTVALAVAAPVPGTGTAGLSFRRFGDELFNAQAVGLGYGHQLGFVRLGVQASLWQTSIETLGTHRALALNFGGTAEVVPTLVFGAFISNLNQARLADYDQERYPTVMRAGLSYRPSDQLMLNAEAEKDIDHPANVRAGLEYRPIERVSLRTGIGTRPQHFAFGVGFEGQALQFDYALSAHPALGYSHHLSIGYRLPAPAAERP